MLCAYLYCWMSYQLIWNANSIVMSANIALLFPEQSLQVNWTANFLFVLFSNGQMLFRIPLSQLNILCQYNDLSEIWLLLCAIVQWKSGVMSPIAWTWLDLINELVYYQLNQDGKKKIEITCIFVVLFITSVFHKILDTSKVSWDFTDRCDVENLATNFDTTSSDK